MVRPYTTKIRAKRIALDYFKRFHWLRRWRLLLSIGVPALGAAWLLGLAAQGDQRAYTSGPVSTGHAMFDLQCIQCHVPAPAAAGQAGQGYWLRVSDRACQKCHDGPAHHANEVGTPACTGCHVEHQGHVVLAVMSDRHCVQCHADLKTKEGPTAFERSTRGFATAHPEFAVRVADKAPARRVRLDDKAGLKDTAQVKLNHQKHLKAGLKGLDALKADKGMRGLAQKPEGLQLTCAFCHQPDERRAYMVPIDYVKHCGLSCHPLDFDGRLPDALAPHDKPLLVRAFLREVFTSAFEGCQALKEAGKKDEEKKDEDKKEEGAKAKAAKAPDAAAEALKKRCQDLELLKAEEEGESPRGRRGGKRDEPDEAASPQQWVAAQLQNAEKLVFKQKCEFCHMLSSPADGALPDVAPTRIPARWLPHSTFDHGAHRPIGCAECHKAAESKETTDVLLPGIAACRECHRVAGGARSGCVECHRYHDKTRERDLNGPFTIREFVRGSPPPAMARAGSGR